MTQKQQSQPCFPCDSGTGPHRAVRRPPLVVPPAGKSEACRSCSVLDAVPNPRLWLRGTNISFPWAMDSGIPRPSESPGGADTEVRHLSSRDAAGCSRGLQSASGGSRCLPHWVLAASHRGDGRSAAEFPPSSMELYLRERTLPPSFFSSRPRFPQQAPAPLLSVAPSRTASCPADPARCPPLKNGPRSFSMEPRGARAAAGVAVSREGGATFRLFPLPLAVA